MSQAHKIKHRKQSLYNILVHDYRETSSIKKIVQQYIICADKHTCILQQDVTTQPYLRHKNYHNVVVESFYTLVVEHMDNNLDHILVCEDLLFGPFLECSE